jgi:hypothetical protein
MSAIETGLYTIKSQNLNQFVGALPTSVGIRLPIGAVDESTEQGPQQVRSSYSWFQATN